MSDTTAGAPAATTPDEPVARPPSWDPLGVAPFAWDLPEPTTPAQPPDATQASRSRLTPVVLGLAVLAAAGAGAGAAAGVTWLTPARIAAIALAVIGIGILHGAFRRRGLGLLVAAVPVAGFVVLASLVGPFRFDAKASGTHTWRPTDVEQLRSQYRVQFGDSTLDLRRLNLAGSRSVDLDVTAGHLLVLVPPSMNTETTCTAVAAQCPPEGQVVADKTNGHTLGLDIDVRAGQVEVRRG
jgi:hypothetical protein